MLAAHLLMPPGARSLRGTLQSLLQQPAASAVRAFAVGSSAVNIFDRQLKQAHRDRAALLQAPDDPLLAGVAAQLMDRLHDVKRTFHTAAILGGAGQAVMQQLAGGAAGVQQVMHLDLSAAMLDRAQRAAEQARQAGQQLPRATYLQADEEHLPLAPHSVDLIISCLGLHWVNDLPGALVQCRRALRPDGLLLAAMFGGDTLHELRVALAAAEEEVEGGISQRVSPLVQVADAGSLLTAAGFMIPAIDSEEIQVFYKDFQGVTQHLRALGESNAVRMRRPCLHQPTAAAAAARLQQAANGDGVPITYQVISLTGWAPAPTQQRPAQRGSATASFEDISKAVQSKGSGATEQQGSIAEKPP